MSNSQSLELIDVSGEPTPPPTTKDKELWVVEDSLKDNPGVYQGGAVQTPGGSFIEDEEDDLYGESPEAQTRRIAREALRESLSISKEASTLTAEDSHAASGARKEQPVSSRTAEEQARRTSQKARPVDQPLAAITNGEYHQKQMILHS